MWWDRISHYWGASAYTRSRTRDGTPASAACHSPPSTAYSWQTASGSQSAGERPPSVASRGTYQSQSTSSNKSYKNVTCSSREPRKRSLVHEIPVLLLTFDKSHLRWAPSGLGEGISATQCCGLKSEHCAGLGIHDIVTHPVKTFLGSEQEHLLSQDSAREQLCSRTTRCKDKKQTHKERGRVRSSTTTLQMAKIWRKTFRAGHKHSICGIVKEPSRNLGNF
jgi:hypothetical protein